jgi:hypothetical protein
VARAKGVAALILLVAALALGAYLRVHEIQTKPQIAHDEVATLLAATGHMGAFEAAANGGLSGRWVPASQWKAFLQPGPFWDFGTIATDLAHYDNHPPLFFWLLHAWVAVFGVTLTSAAYFNVVIAALATICLFGLARRVLGDALEAGLVALVWSLSPPVIATSYMARHYDMFALMTIVFVWLLVRATDTSRRLRWYDVAAVGLAAAAGTLTHYQFAIVAVGGAVYAIARLARHHWRRLLALAAALPAALVLFVAGMPHFASSLHNQTGQVHHLTHAELRGRLHQVKAALSAFFGLHARQIAVLVLGLVVIALALAVLARVPATRRVAGTLRGALSRRGWSMLFFAAWIGGGTIGFYLLGRSPDYAMHDRYLAALWPFLAIGVVLAARLLGRLAPLAVVLFCGLALLPATLTWIKVVPYGAPSADAKLADVRFTVPSGDLAGARGLLIDVLQRSVFLRTVWWLRDGTPVYAAWQTDLLADPTKWMPSIAAYDIYATAPAKSNTWAGAAKVRDLIRQQGLNEVPIASPGWDVAHLYRIE